MNSTNSSSIELCIPHGTGPLLLGNNTCSTSNVLTELGIYNTVAIAVSLVTGHQAFRNIVPSFLPVNGWKPWSGISMCITHLLANIISTAISRVNGYESSFIAFMGLWILRPRITFIMLPLAWATKYIEKGSSSSYEWTFLDMTIFESLMNIVSIPFAIKLRANINSNLCTNNYIQSMGIQPMLYNFMKSSLGFTIVAGIASTILLATICIPALDRSKGGVEGGRLSVLKLLFMILSGGMLISNWLFWAGK
jgi:hypothetical protein